MAIWEKWTDDPKRCLKAGIPYERIKHKSKEELALELVLDVRRLNLRYGWIGADAGYGKGPDFPIKLDSMGETFVIDVHKDQAIFLEAIEPKIPDCKGKKPTKYQVEAKPVRVRKWVSQQPSSAWQKVKIRESTKGYLTYEILTHRVWLWRKEDSQAYCWQLIVRRNAETQSDCTYSLSNAPEKTGTKRLAYMQSQRFWIERVFVDGKSECGMADYQLRSWVG